MKKLILVIVLILFSSPYLTGTVSAESAVFTDDFSGNLDKWQPLRDDGRFWSISNGALQALVPMGSTVSELIPNQESWKPTKSYDLELDFTALSGVDKNIAFGVQDKNNWYEIHFAESFTELAKVKNGTVIWSKSYPFVLQNGSNHHLSVLFISGRVYVLINGSTLIDTIDPTYAPEIGTIALKATTGSIFPTKIRIDNVKLQEIKDTPEPQDTILGVTLVKQTDAQWADKEYDTADVWAKNLPAGTSIKDWGCNLVSMAMVLQYHGISTFTDGTPITPLTLNDWLKSNHGYYNSPQTGNIDRKSISQLTAEISKQKDTPKLEFKYVGENLLETAVTEIEKGNPVILELDGHFVVADGFTADKKDLYIKDPSYDVTKLSQHPLPLKSVRLFTPSHTDLSYISIASDETTTVTLVGANPTVTYTEQLKAPLPQSTLVAGPVSKITEVVQPSSSDYTVDITVENPKNSSATLTTYTQDGTSQQFAFQDLKMGTHQYRLHYAKNGTSTLEMKKASQLSYQDLRKTIRQLAKTNQIKVPYIKKVLIDLLKPIELVSKKNQKKILVVIHTIIESAPKAIITSAAKALLLDQIKLLMADRF